MTDAPARVLLGLSPPDEQQIEQLLYQSEKLTVVAAAANAHELAGLASSHAVDAVLLSADLPGIDTGAVARLRARGVRSVGLAVSESAAAALARLDVDAIVRPPLTGAELLTQLRDPDGRQATRPADRRPLGAESRHGSGGNVLAVVGSKGAPGASELALSLAALLARQWPVLLAECDGDGGSLALRLGADPQQGSLLALARALQRDDPDLDQLLPGWLAGGEHGWPAVLLAAPDPQHTLSELAAPGSTQALLDTLAQRFALVVCDVGQRLSRIGEPDLAVRLHRDVLVAADAVALVLGARHEQLHAGFCQLDLLLSELSIPAERIRVAVNSQAAAAATDADTAQAISRQLEQRELRVDVWLPWDQRALRRAVRLGTPLALARPRSRYTKTLQRLLESLLAPAPDPDPVRSVRLETVTPEVEPEGMGEVALPWR